MICVVIQAQNERIAVAIGGHAGQTVRGAVDQPVDGCLVIGGQGRTAFDGQAQQHARSASGVLAAISRTGRAEAATSSAGIPAERRSNKAGTGAVNVTGCPVAGCGRVS